MKDRIAIGSEAFRCWPDNQVHLHTQGIQMKKFFALIAIVAAVSACSKKEEAPAASVAAPAAAATTAAASNLPKECQEYLDKVLACGTKGGMDAAAMKASLEENKIAFAQLGSNGGPACKMMNDNFGAQAAAMKC